MFIENNEKYNRLINEWESLYNTVMCTHWHGKFDFYITDDIQNDYQKLLEEGEVYLEPHKLCVGLMLPPYKTRQKPLIILSTATFTNSIDTFFHEYTHAIHISEFFDMLEWDTSKFILKSPSANTFRLWSEAYATYYGLYFYILLENKGKTKQALNSLKNPKSSRKHFSYAKNLIKNENHIPPSLIMQFLGAYILLEKYCPALYRDYNLMPCKIIVECDTPPILDNIYNIIKNNNSTRKILSENNYNSLTNDFKKLGFITTINPTDKITPLS